MAFVHVACLDPRCFDCGVFWDHQLGIPCQDPDCSRCYEDEEDDW